MSDFLIVIHSQTGDDMQETIEYFQGVVDRIKKDFSTSTKTIKYLEGAIKKFQAIQNMATEINSHMGKISDELDEVLDLYDEEVQRGGYTSSEDTEYVEWKIKELENKIE
jgi:methyl-accepting chemotaxis protein